MMALVLIKQLLILSEGLLNFKRQSKKPIITSPCEYLKSKNPCFSISQYIEMEKQAFYNNSLSEKLKKSSFVMMI
jgi:hypothetical protein